MDTLTAANAFATILQLLAVFKQARADRATIDHRDFLNWLSEHHLEQLKQFIANSAVAQSEVDYLLRKENHDAVMARLNEIASSVAAIAHGGSELSGLAKAVVPESEFSEQAISILRQMTLGCNQVILLRGSSAEAILSCIEPGEVEYTDPKFLEDDMETLAAHGLLSTRSPTGPGTIYSLTRKGAKFIQMIDGSSRG